MSIAEILDAVAPSEGDRALAMLLVLAACEEACAAMLDELPRLVQTLTEVD